MQGILGMKAAMGGFAITPMSLTWVMGSFIAGRVILKYPVKWILTGSLIIVAFSGAFMLLLPISAPFCSLLTSDSDYWD